MESLPFNWVSSASRSASVFGESSGDLRSALSVSRRARSMFSASQSCPSTAFHLERYNQRPMMKHFRDDQMIAQHSALH